MKWVKSSFCSTDRGCVEVSFFGTHQPMVGIRASQRGEQPRLIVTREEWDAFIAGVKAGEFDGLSAGAATPREGE